jgi:hypothetical protein
MPDESEARAVAMPEFPIRKIAVMVGEIFHEGVPLATVGELSAADIKAWDGQR